MELIIFYFIGVFMAFCTGLIHNKLICPLNPDYSKVVLPVIFFSWLIVIALFVGMFVSALEKKDDSKKSFFRWYSS